MTCRFLEHSYVRGCVVAAAILCSTSTSYADQDWDPTKTWLVAVGVLEWQHPQIWRGMPNAKVDRRDVQLVDWFQSAGVPKEHIVYLHDRQATHRRIQDELAGLLRKTRPGDLLVLYYTGHGSRDRRSREVHFANYDATNYASAWRVRSIIETIEQNFRGEKCLLLADCCYSGGLADEAQRYRTRVPYAFLCSAYSHNSSTGKWTFTDAVLKGLRGDPAVDRDADGEIEFEEIGHYAELDMGFVEQQKSVYGRTHGFPARMKLSQVQGERTDRLGDRIEAEWRGKWYRAQIIESRPDEFRVHYVNFDHSWDEWIDASRIRKYAPAQFPAGTAVQIRWADDQRWYPGTILKSWYGLYFVHYTGYPAEWDEWVRPPDVRR